MHRLEYEIPMIEIVHFIADMVRTSAIGDGEDEDLGQGYF